LRATEIGQTVQKEPEGNQAAVRTVMSAKSNQKNGNKNISTVRDDQAAGGLLTVNRYS
jgi:hypothetical protein